MTDATDQVVAVDSNLVNGCLKVLVSPSGSRDGRLGFGDVHRAALRHERLMASTPRLATKRLELVPLDVGAADEMAAVLSGRALYEYIGGEPPDITALRDRYERLVVGRSSAGRYFWHNWIVRLGGGGIAIGTVQATVAMPPAGPRSVIRDAGQARREPCERG